MPIIYLLRHADAVMGVPDENRPLSQKGIMQVQELGHFLKTCNWFQPECVWHSGLKRAEETALTLLEAIDRVLPIDVMPQLSPNGQAEVMAKRFKVLSKNTLIVSHNPFLEKLASSLLETQAESPICHFRKGGLMVFEKNEDRFVLLHFVQ